MENLLHDINQIPKEKTLIIFDLDGTLTESKSEMDSEMAGLFEKLLGKKKIAVIGGGRYEQFQIQILGKLGAWETYLKNLFLFPLTATSFYKYIEGQWQCIYSMDFSEEEKKKIFDAFEKTFTELNYHPEDAYQNVVEDRGSEITFSALGQNAPLDLKEEWKKESGELKIKILKILQNYLPEMEVRAAGYTSIDITRKGIDKEYGINQIKIRLGIDFTDMLFVGDALFVGGNDSAALRTGIQCFEVESVEDTKKLIRYILE